LFDIFTPPDTQATRLWFCN